MDQEVHLTWRGPFSFYSDQGLPCVFEDEFIRSHCGVYLWTIEHEGGYLVNYVGKTTRTFAVRFAEELEYERAQELRVDVDLLFQGIRKPVEPHRDRVEEVLKAYRIFAAPLPPDLGDSAFLGIERTLINAFHDAGAKYSSFLWNPRCRRRFNGTLTIDPSNLLGLEGGTISYSEE
jgi:hypothetical protein